MTEETKKSSSFAVALEPEFNEDGAWTGSVTAFVEETLMDDLADEDAMKIRAVCGMLASCLTLMEEDEEFLAYVRDYFEAYQENMLNELLGDISEDKPNYTKDGNLITLNFNTKTYGNA